MESTRDEVVRILHERGACAVAELAPAMGVSQGSVRRQLDIMTAAGLVDSRRERRPRGRPLTVYSLSEAGEERSSSVHYARLLDHIYPALSDLAAAEVSGQAGSAILWRMFERIAERVAEERAPHVRSAQLGERVGEVVRALREVGVLNEVVDEGDAFRLSNVGCPCRSTAEETDAACEADRYSIELLLGAPVEQVSTIAGGSNSCEYLVRKSTGETALAGFAVSPGAPSEPLHAGGLSSAGPSIRGSGIRGSGIGSSGRKGSGMRARVELQ
ncbi:MAG: MarR family transcriptional regulator [Chloroflexi bacterium]|nr:MarR family transcriptional regulator [Chloroflexota bacterium]